jgi:thiamine-phosphate pyrophosphorylase
MPRLEPEPQVCTLTPVIQLPRLYAIVDVDVCARAGWAPRDLARAYLSGGARLLQLRAKSLDGGAFLEVADAMVTDARKAGAQIVVNDRADLAMLSRADGVHVGQDDLAPREVRSIVGPNRLVGLSTHTHEQIEAALSESITYLAIGPTFATGTKETGYEAVGYDAVRHAAARAASAALPLVAIGGITIDTAPRVIAAGAASVAVISDLLTDDPEGRVRQFIAALR